MQERDFVKLDDVRRMLGNVSRNTVFRLIRLHNFPRPFKPAGVNLWDKSEILEYLEKSRTSGGDS